MRYQIAHESADATGIARPRTVNGFGDAAGEDMQLDVEVKRAVEVRRQRVCQRPLEQRGRRMASIRSTCNAINSAVLVASSGPALVCSHSVEPERIITACASACRSAQRAGRLAGCAGYASFYCVWRRGG